MEIKLLSCPLCLKPHFQGVESLRTTLIKVATSQLKCPVCSEILLGLDKFTIHLFTHINVEETVVNTTEKELNECIDNINKAVLEKENNEIKCDICNFTFTDRNILDMHQKLLHQTLPDKNTGLYSYHCHLCNKNFKKRGSLMVHLRVAHYGFGHKSDFVAQEMIKSDASSNGNTQSSTILLQEQIKIQDNKQWECDVCSKLFTTKYFLKKHKRLHTGEMPYFCAKCNKAFTFQQSYHKHMLYHSSEKPYVCNECGRAFKELSTLQNHVRIHSGERPFGCETCGKRFRQRVSYLVHQRIHTGVMPYKCTACDKSFRYKVSQRSHKCPMNPPGSVVKVTEPEKIHRQDISTISPSSNNENVKCIMSVDYSTGNINLIHSNALLMDNTKTETNLQEKSTELEKKVGSLTEEIMCKVDPVYSTEQPDLFSMVMSPLLPNVESLCLTNSSVETESKMETLTDKDNDSSQIMSQDHLNLFYYSNDNK